MGFPERLRELREKREISQNQIAQSLNVCISAISKYESGVNSPDVKKLIKIAEIFNVSIDYLLGLSDIFIPLYGTETARFIIKLPSFTTQEQFGVVRKIAAVILKTEIKAFETDSFSERLKKLRYDKEIRQKELAIDFKVTTAAISEYETGKNFPNVRKLIKIAEEFNVSVDYLLGFSDSPYPLHSEKVSALEISLPLNTTPEQYRLIQRMALSILSVDFLPKSG